MIGRARREGEPGGLLSASPRTRPVAIVKPERENPAQESRRRLREADPERIRRPRASRDPAPGAARSATAIRVAGNRRRRRASSTDQAERARRSRTLLSRKRPASTPGMVPAIRGTMTRAGGGLAAGRPASTEEELSPTIARDLSAEREKRGRAAVPRCRTTSKESAIGVVADSRGAPARCRGARSRRPARTHVSAPGSRRAGGLQPGS